MKIRLMASRGTPLDDIIAACKNVGVNIVDKDEDILIYIYTDEYKRAKKLVGDIKDKTKLKAHRNPKHIPEVWSIILEDNKKDEVVKCDYFINGNIFFSEVIRNIKRVSLGVKLGGSNMESKERIIREQTRVYLNKNKDYGNSFVDQLDELGEIAFTVVAGFKISRMAQLYKTQQVEHESALDSYLDLLNYAAMFKMWQSDSEKLADFVQILRGLIDVSAFIELLETVYDLKEDEKEAILHISKELFSYYV